MVLGWLPKVKLIHEGIHERCWKKQEQKPAALPRLPPPNLQGAGKNVHGMCTSPWWQLSEITHCSPATLRNTSNPVFETAISWKLWCSHSLQESLLDGHPAHEGHSRPRQTSQYYSGKADGPILLPLSTSRKGIAARKGDTEIIPHKYPHQQLLAVVVTSWMGTRDRDCCSVFTITPKITTK